jgi:hypothetical protein
MAGVAPVAPQEAGNGQPGLGVGNGRARLKLVLLGLVLLGLGGILGFSLSREVAGPADGGRGAAGGPPRIAQRPALSADEQAYVEALWPIHTEVEVAAERVGLGAIFYKTNDVDRAELKARLDGALASFRAADQKLRVLHPPASLESSHATYVSAVGLFEQSAVEMLRMFDDGSEDHLLAAYPLSLEGSGKIREVGGKFWPDEFPPN